LISHQINTIIFSVTFVNIHLKLILFFLCV